jgi:hypothetical protein
MKFLLLTALWAACAAAQTPSEPPTLIQLIRQPGLDGQPLRPYSNVQAPLTVLGMSTITGVPETWLMELHDSFVSIEDLDKALLPAVRSQLDSMESQGRFQIEVVAPPRSIIAVYRPEWSYRASEALRLFPRAHYFYVSIYTIRPGAEAKFSTSVRQRRATFDVVNLDRPELAYQVFSGVPSGTFVFFAPLASLKPMDEALTKSSEAATKAPDEGEISREHFLLRVEPRLSHVSDEFAETEPEFWRGKTKPQ